MKKNASIVSVPKREDIPELSVPRTEPLWTVLDVANYLRLTPETVRNKARRGELPSIKVGKRIWRFKVSEVKKWLMIQIDENKDRRSIQ